MNVPLAERLRPLTLEGFVGQEHLFGDDGFLTAAMTKKTPTSLLFWGPPGSGKTTIARIYAKGFRARVVSLSGVSAGVQAIKTLVKEVEEGAFFKEPTMLFIDEIHRFNKAQQDALLPYLEKGVFFLVAATTENPSFSINNALLSRLHVLTLNSLKQNELEIILKRYEEERKPLLLDLKARAFLIDLAQGDARQLFNMIEQLPQEGKQLTPDLLVNLFHKKTPHYDKDGDYHYQLISALHKSIRGSDPDAALYWLARMLEGGEDPLYLARRLIRIANEDIGLADPQAIQQALAALQTYQVLGSPEGELALAQVVIYLALAPKSNRIYSAFKNALALAKETTNLPPPKMSINAPTKMMQKMGFGENYHYDHDTFTGCAGQNYFPEELSRIQLYQPVERGFEREMKKRVDYFFKLRK